MTQVYRFVDSANGTVGGRHYDIRREDGATAWTCDTTGPAVNEVIAFSGDGGQPLPDLPNQSLTRLNPLTGEGFTADPPLGDDIFAGDVYFKTSRPDHNLDRARVQFRMVECMEGLEREMAALEDDA